MTERASRALRPSFPLGPVKVRAGSRQEVSLPVSRLITGAEVSLPVHVLHGRQDGPTVWISAAIHGDEVVGIEVVRRVLEQLSPRALHGTLIAVPIVNVIGVMTGDRYLPDRRDLNRSFPGAPRGSLASRIAHLLMREVISACDVGIDLHTAADRRSNLPQIRCDLEDPQTRVLAEAFAAPVINHARLRDGSLRMAAREAGARVLLYEGGEAWRFDEWAIQPAVDGVLRVLASLGMISPDLAPAPPQDANTECWSSSWVRARRDGLVHLSVSLGQHVEVGDRLGALYDSFGKRQGLIKAESAGIVIGRAEAPLVHRGDALVHIGQVLHDDDGADHAGDLAAQGPHVPAAAPEV